MIDNIITQIRQISCDFTSIQKAATKFIDCVNEKLASENEKEISASVLFCISTTLPKKRSTRCPLEGISDPLKFFEVSCHNIILDKVIESFEKIYASHVDLYKQIACFDSSRFNEVKANPEKLDLRLISEAIPNIDTVALREELVSFASSYKNLQNPHF